MVEAAPANLLVLDTVPAPPAPGSWTLLPGEGAVEVLLEGPVPGAHHCRLWVRPDAAVGWTSGGTIPAAGGRLRWVPPDPYESGPWRWSLFALSAVDARGAESPRSDQKLMCYQPLMGADEVLSAPALTTGGGLYPLVSRVPVGPHYAFSVSLQLEAPAGKEDRVARYELERRDDLGGGQLQWSEWERLPEFVVHRSGSGQPAPRVVLYDNTDRRLQPGRRYAWRARGVGRNGVPGLWSQPQELLLTDDTTAPDTPSLEIRSFVGANKLKLSDPAVAGGPCPDFSHFRIEGRLEGEGATVVLDEHLVATFFTHIIDDSELGQRWQYRAIAFDHSGNASPAGPWTGWFGPKHAGGAYLSAAVNQTLAQVAINSAEIELRVEQGQVISAINLSPEGIDIQGGRIALNGDTVFSADCEIYGELRLCRTSGGNERIEIGSYNGCQELRAYTEIALPGGGAAAHLGAVLTKLVVSDTDTVPIWRLTGTDVFGVGSNPGWALSGWGLQPGGYASLGLPDAVHLAHWPLGDGPQLGFDRTTKELVVREGGASYRYAHT